ncbi:MAG: heavy metal translocating P-type ATPase, partial [Anaerolineales bacterium]|nr:heavy metal translocating P-type ATPase [Anaerolineales bacterium]
MFRRRFWVCLGLSLPVIAYSPTIQGWFDFSPPAFPGSQWITPLVSLIIFAYGGVPFLQMAVPELRARRPGMMTLISLAISVAFVYSLSAMLSPEGETFFWELVTLIDIMLLGHWLEMRSVRQASSALQELAKLLPDTAELLTDQGPAKEIPVHTLRAGDLVLVRPGSSVPADGEVVDGESDVNEAMVTGESRPVGKSPGAKVIAGTINGAGSLRVRVTATGDETALAGIMRLVEQAQQSKSNTQILADKAAGWLFYIALGVAVITAVAWTIAIGFDAEVVARVATVLVIACPHALGLAVPLVVSITTAIGARNGILVRTRLALEEARTVNTVIFDKTGTLTRGEFGVVDVAVTNGWTEDQALALTASVESDSEHTIARGILRTADERSLAIPRASEFEAIRGRGVRALVEGHNVYVGGPRLLEALGAVPPDELRKFEQREGRKGRSVVYLLQDKRPVACLALADVVRPDSKLAVERLHAMGVEVAMLTGDSWAVAEAVAQEL